MHVTSLRGGEAGVVIHKNQWTNFWIATLFLKKKLAMTSLAIVSLHFRAATIAMRFHSCVKLLLRFITVRSPLHYWWLKHAQPNLLKICFL